jgi:hypothetical protein
MISTLLHPHVRILAGRPAKFTLAKAGVFNSQGCSKL